MKFTLCTLFLCLLGATVADAEVSVRECIAFSPEGTSSVVEANNTWTELTGFDLNLSSPSDAIFGAVVFFGDAANTSGSRVDYRVVLNGGTTYKLGTNPIAHERVPPVRESSQRVYGYFAGIPAGTYRASLQVRNVSAFPISYNGAWIFPLFVDAAEDSFVDERSSVAINSSTWTTVGAVTPSSSAKYVYLTSYLQMSQSGPAQARILNGNNIAMSVNLNFPYISDGTFISFIVKNPVPGQPIAVQIIGTGTLERTSTWGQQLNRYHMFEATSSAATIPNDRKWHRISTSPAAPISAISMTTPIGPEGNRRTCGQGVGHVIASMSTPTEAFLHLLLLNDLGEPVFADAGVTTHAPGAVLQQLGQPSSWGCSAGLLDQRNYSMALEIVGLCPGGPSINIDKSHFEVLVLPGEAGGYTRTCTTTQVSSCAYVCSWNNSLRTIPEPVRNYCG